MSQTSARPTTTPALVDDVGEQVAPVGDERERVEAPPDADQVHADRRVRDRRSGDERQAEVETAQLRADQDLLHRRDADHQRRDRDQRALDARREELDLAVPIGMVAIRRLRREVEAREQQRAGRDVHERLEGVRQNRRRSGEAPRRELREQHRTPPTSARRPARSRTPWSSEMSGPNGRSREHARCLRREHSRDGS